MLLVHIVNMLRQRVLINRRRRLVLSNVGSA